MITSTPAFRAAADDPQRKPAKRFTFPEDSTDLTDKILAIRTFSQEQFEGDNLSAPTISLDLINDSKEFNFLISDKENQVGIPGKIEIGFDGDWVTRFRGYYGNPSFTSTDRPRCEMTFTGRIQETLDRSVGSNATPVSYYANSWNPADMLWNILTVHGNLDNTASTANTDIDYASWLLFKSTCTDLTFLLRGNFNGQSVAESLRIIGELVDGLIYGETDGKIYFAINNPGDTTNPAYLFTEENAHLQQAETFYNNDRLVNRLIVWWGYDVAQADWASGGSVQKDDAVSQARAWGLHKRDFDQSVVWHDNFISADSFSGRYIDKYRNPLDTVRFSTKRGTQALLHQIGDPIKLTWPQMDYVDKALKIYGISGNLTSDEWTILAEDNSALLSLDFFTLDSPLDTSILY